MVILTSCARSHLPHTPPRAGNNTLLPCIDTFREATLETKTRTPSKQTNEATSWVCTACETHHLIKSFLRPAAQGFGSQREGCALCVRHPKAQLRASRRLGDKCMLHNILPTATGGKRNASTYLNHLAGFMALPEIPVTDATCSLTSVSPPSFTQAF